MFRPCLTVSLLLSATWLPLAAQRTKPLTIAQLEARARSDSLVPEAYYRLGIAYARAKRHEEAGTAFSHALAIDGRYTPALVALAFQPYRRRPKLAEEERKGAVPPEWRDSLFETRRLLRRAFYIDPLAELLPPDDEPSARLAALLFQAYLFRVARGRPRDSLPSYLLWYRGLADGRAGRHASGIEDFKALLKRAEAMESDSLIPFPVATNDYRYVIAVLFERSGKPADALEYYRETLAHDLGHYMAHVRLAGLYRQNEMWRDAVTEARRAVDANPDDAASVRELGETLLAAGRADEAEEPLCRAREMNPRDIGTHYVLGAVYMSTGRIDSARSAFTTFAAAAPTQLYGKQIADAQRRLELLRGRP